MVVSEFEMGLPIANDPDHASYTFTVNGWRALPKTEKGLVTEMGLYQVRVYVFGPNDIQPVYIEGIRTKPIAEILKMKGKL